MGVSEEGHAQGKRHREVGSTTTSAQYPQRLKDTFALERAGHFAGYARDYADTVGKDHGRIETRRCWVTGDPDRA